MAATQSSFALHQASCSLLPHPRMPSTISCSGKTYANHRTPASPHQSRRPPMQASARIASSASSKRVSVGVRSYQGSRGNAHAAPLSAQEPPPKGQKRISKQERRVIIEEFVDKYRASNEGKFPTTACVRQQIGGGHYTV